jgi:hypothetical protein
MRFYLFGIFAVRRDLIHLKPLAYYQMLLEHVNYDVDPVEGHFFERSWYYIFQV